MNDANFALLCPGWRSFNNSCQCSIHSSIWVKHLTSVFQTSCRPWSCFDCVWRMLKSGMWKSSAEVTRWHNFSFNADKYVGGSWRGQLVAFSGRITEWFKYFWYRSSGVYVKVLPSSSSFYLTQLRYFIAHLLDVECGVSSISFNVVHPTYRNKNIQLTSINESFQLSPLIVSFLVLFKHMVHSMLDPKGTIELFLAVQKCKWPIVSCFCHTQFFE